MADVVRRRSYSRAPRHRLDLNRPMVRRGALLECIEPYSLRHFRASVCPCNPVSLRDAIRGRPLSPIQNCVLAP